MKLKLKLILTKIWGVTYTEGTNDGKIVDIKNK